jgi:hypothetical protein
MMRKRGREALLCAKLYCKAFALTPRKEITMIALNPACAKPESSQATIEELAERCLRNSPYQALRGVTCNYLGGVLFLRGWLPTYYLKLLAQEAVIGLAGVQGIDNQIQVVTPSRRSRHC